MSVRLRPLLATQSPSARAWSIVIPGSVSTASSLPEISVLAMGENSFGSPFGSMPSCGGASLTKTSYVRVLASVVLMPLPSRFRPPVAPGSSLVDTRAPASGAGSNRSTAAPGALEAYLRLLDRAGRNGSLGGVFDHVAIAVTDLAASERFYRTVLSVLGAEPSHADAELVEWADWDIGPTDREHPLTRGLHVGFRAPSREAVDAFWQAGIDAGYRDAGAPGPRPVYGPDYYGGFLLDPDGNSAEAVHWEREDPVPEGRIDHLWLRVRDPGASKRFYMTIAPHPALRLGADEPDHIQMVGEDFSFSLIDDERPLTEHVHFAFPAQDDATVRAFHAAALAAGYEDHGGPGERAVYHPGYYGAFVLEPDGHNVEVVNHNR